MKIRTPRGHNPTQLGIQSPGFVLRPSGMNENQVNESYFEKLKNQYAYGQTDLT